MPKFSPSLASLPPDAAQSLAALGEHLAIARIRRKESQRQWAQRLGISAPTLIRMERGDPSVSMGIYASALWMLGLVQTLGEIAAPDKDQRALEGELRTLHQHRAVRRQASVEARLARSRDKT